MQNDIISKQESLVLSYRRFVSNFADKQTVPGCGNPDCKLLLIGEAPGKDEVRLSKPFVGAAGKYLDEFLNYIGIDRNDIYITNAIKYRLAKANQDTGRISNRPATREEIDLCRPYLYEEIDIIKPSHIVTLGNVPLRSVTGDPLASIGTCHGTVTRINILGMENRLFALYHPASLIYNRSLKDTYYKDLGLLKKAINCSF